MPLRVVVVGKVLLVRQPIAQSLGALDFEVFESFPWRSVSTC